MNAKQITLAARHDWIMAQLERQEREITPEKWRSIEDWGGVYDELYGSRAERESRIVRLWGCDVNKEQKE
jgi:hypothetical protein